MSSLHVRSSSKPFLLLSPANLPPLFLALELDVFHVRLSYLSVLYPNSSSRGFSPLCVHPGVTEWTSWFNIDHPGGNGDYERLEAIRFYYRERVCTRPTAMEARTTDWVAAADTGEVVHSSLEKGFWCINKEQPGGRICSNYHVRFQCPPGISDARSSSKHFCALREHCGKINSLCSSSVFSPGLLDRLGWVGSLLYHSV